MVSVSLLLALANSSLTFARFPRGVYSVPTPWSCAPDGSLPFRYLSGCPCCTPTSITCKAALRCGREEGRPISAMWKDICTLDDTRFGELELVSSYRLLISVFPLAPSCGCCLPPLFSLDQDETEWDSALFFLHLPSHASTLDVGLPITIALSHPAVVFKAWRKCVPH